MDRNTKACDSRVYAWNCKSFAVLIKVADGELGYGLSSEVSFYSLGR